MSPETKKLLDNYVTAEIELTLRPTPESVKECNLAVEALKARINYIENYTANHGAEL